MALTGLNNVQVLILPAEHINVYFQRAMPNNRSWTKIKAEHAFDVANPFLTIFNNAIHVVCSILSHPTVKDSVNKEYCRESKQHRSQA